MYNFYFHIPVQTVASTAHICNFSKEKLRHGDAWGLTVFYASRRLRDPPVFVTLLQGRMQDYPANPSALSRFLVGVGQASGIEADMSAIVVVRGHCNSSDSGETFST